VQTTAEHPLESFVHPDLLKTQPLKFWTAPPHSGAILIGTGVMLTQSHRGTGKSLRKIEKTLKKKP